MSIIIDYSIKNYNSLINSKFDFLKDFFQFDPGEIHISILSLNDFENKFLDEKGEKSPLYVVGFAGNNGRVFVLNKDELILKNHNSDEFEKIIVHEFSHIFLRRILNSKQIYIWIEEGICQFLSFGYNKINHKIEFEKIRYKDGWIKNPAYSQSAAFFEFLILKFGKIKLVKFIKDIKDKGEELSFELNFGNFKEIEYEFFEKIK